MVVDFLGEFSAAARNPAKIRTLARAAVRPEYVPVLEF
jgi:hypothetical protein